MSESPDVDKSRIKRQSAQHTHMPVFETWRRCHSGTEPLLCRTADDHTHRDSALVLADMVQTYVVELVSATA